MPPLSDPETRIGVVGAPLDHRDVVGRDVLDLVDRDLVRSDASCAVGVMVGVSDRDLRPVDELLLEDVLAEQRVGVALEDRAGLNRFLQTIVRKRLALHGRWADVQGGERRTKTTIR